MKKLESDVNLALLVLDNLILLLYHLSLIIIKMVEMASKNG